jgi:prevent-host-death family protein
MFVCEPDKIKPTHIARRVDFVVTDDYIMGMKTEREKKRPGEYPAAGTGAVVTVREAKAAFSTLVHRAAAGEEIVITWHGQPKARLASVSRDTAPFKVDFDWLHRMRVGHRQTPSEQIIREDRDARG